MDAVPAGAKYPKARYSGGLFPGEGPAICTAPPLSEALAASQTGAGPSVQAENLRVCENTALALLVSGEEGTVLGWRRDFWDMKEWHVGTE